MLCFFFFFSPLLLPSLSFCFSSYNSEKAWRQYETERIKNQDLSGMAFGSAADREQYVHAQLEELLLKEVQLLQTIDRLKLQAAKGAKIDNTQRMLTKVGLTLSVCLCLFVSVSLSLSVCVCLFLSHSLCLFVFVCFCLTFVCLSVCSVCTRWPCPRTGVVLMTATCRWRRPSPSAPTTSWRYTTGWRCMTSPTASGSSCSKPCAIPST